MLFVALAADGRTVSLAGAERWEREGLMRLKRQEPFFCPACRQDSHFAPSQRKSGGFFRSDVE
ncbi:hypothetical protein BGM21_03745 [Geobacillus thermoleovorans]|nr:hypothetical protein BGM21_03745 [Geobacillus thermoleovorans]